MGRKGPRVSEQRKFQNQEVFLDWLSKLKFRERINKIRYVFAKEYFFDFSLFGFFFLVKCFCFLPESHTERNKNRTIYHFKKRENSYTNGIENSGISKSRIGWFSKGKKCCYLLYSSSNYILTLELVLQYKWKNIVRYMPLLP